jgi:hypothetical protein
MSIEITKISKVREPKGLEDGGHVIIKCSSCKRPLVDIWCTRPDRIDPRTNQPFLWKFVAHCCYCGGKSYPTEVKGGLHIGGYGINQYDGKELINAQEKTSIISQEDGEDNVIFIKTARYTGS